MLKIMGWIFGLVALYLVLVYYVGAGSLVNTSTYSLGSIISRLQGKDSNGNVANYPRVQ